MEKFDELMFRRGGWGGGDLYSGEGVGGGGGLYSGGKKLPLAIC